MTHDLESTPAEGLTSALLEVRHLVKHFVRKRGLWGPSSVVKAVDGISFTVARGETLGVVGESGCGKTTTAKLILAQEAATGGSIEFRGQDVTKMRKHDLMDYRKSVQVVFQDPFSSLSPRMRVSDIIAEPLEVHTKLSKRDIKLRVGEVLELVWRNAGIHRIFYKGGREEAPNFPYG